jgi:hypothetical protein
VLHVLTVRDMQRGQTLVIFTIVTAFMLLATMALVGNTQVLFVNSDRADAAALLAAQAGASAIDETVLYQSNAVVLDRTTAGPRCERAGAQAGATVKCALINNNTAIEARATVQVHMPIPLWSATETVSSTRTASPAYGGVRAR